MTDVGGSRSDKLKLRINVDTNFVVDIKHAIVDFETCVKATCGFEIFLFST